MSKVVGIPPYTFIHILNLNTNITRLEIGPQNFVLQNNEKLLTEPCPMVKIPPGHYCIIKNPMSKYKAGEYCELKLGESKVKLNGEPFPLYPGESLQGAENFGISSGDYMKAVKALPVVPVSNALKLTAIVDHEDGDVYRRAGDMWHVEGPVTYIPTVQAEILEMVKPIIIHTDEVVRLRALQDCIDKKGSQRVTGEEWIISDPGAYLPGVCEEVVVKEEKITLTPETGLHLAATQTLVDITGKQRQTGEEWLITGEDVNELSPQIGVAIVREVYKTVLSKGKYCVIVNPVDKDGKPQHGQFLLKKGLTSFFLHPAEYLEKGIQSAFVLSNNESIVLQAVEDFTDDMFKDVVNRKAGDRWMLLGPLEYIPPIHVKILKHRKTIPLSKNEGVYVQNIRTGQVRAVMGPCSYMLEEWEELWKKPLQSDVEELLRCGGGTGTGDIRKLAYYEQSIDPKVLKGRDETCVITYRIPGNTALQIYNYQKKTARVMFGPDLAVLGPHENFNVLSLSAGKPKKTNALKSLCLMLGPDFITDIIEVETSDHARLQVKVAFNNHFEYVKGDKESEKKIFAVPDFIGFACNQIGGKIRAAIAQVPFDKFHRNSLQVIQYAVLGRTGGQVKFEVNNMVVSSLDVQSIEPVDKKMRDSLSKSVQLAIEISTSSVEAAASHEASRNEQVARGNLERQKLVNERNSELERTKLLELCAMTAAVESTGQAKAEAQAIAEKTLIECHSEIEAARLKAEALSIEHRAKLESQILMRKHEIDYARRQNELELNRSKRIADIEVTSFNNKVQVLGVETVKSMARAGPESQVKLLQGIGLESVLVTDGNSPINLFNTSTGLIGGKC
ncbi:major vault protein [Patella vulgata]|uniref:major vault protein n=1 Tax=Patella vulgata TaxID=6465 RepID=UPI00217FB750|nr:major vault protein [Patella vulgata]